MLTRHIVCVPLGTRGDVDPVLWFASQLRQQGHTVELVMEAHTASLAEAWAMTATVQVESPVGQALATDPQTAEPAAAQPKLAGWLWDVAKRMAPSILDLIADDPDAILLAPPFAKGAVVAARVAGASLLAAMPAPSFLCPPGESQAIFGASEWTASCMRRRALEGRCWRLAGRLAHGRLPMGRLRSRPLCLFPGWFVPKRWRKPSTTLFTGFIPQSLQPIPSEIGTFLKSGQPPLAITFGTTTPFMGSRIEMIVAAARRTGRRCIVFAAAREGASGHDLLHVPSRASPSALALCAGVLHAATMGSFAVALQAAAPQLVWPVTSDQPLTAKLLCELGVAAMTGPEDFVSGQAFKRVSDSVIDGPLGAAMRRQCAELVRNSDPSELGNCLLEIARG